MIIVNILAGLLSTMNVYVAKLSDISFSLNDVYMVGLMTSYMIFFMSLYYKDFHIMGISFIFVGIFLYCIRSQIFIDEKQYLLGMIPHHSMAIHISKKLYNKQNSIKELLVNIVQTQEKEIEYMKNVLNM
jgi:hypothetical protein